MEEQAASSRARIVLLSCILFNATIGVLYAWSVIQRKLVTPLETNGFAWSSSQAGAPFSLAVIVFAAAMLFGGRLQDRIGPRWIVTAGAVFTGLGFILSGLVGNSVVGITLSFGVLSAIGMGFGYACVTPPALKWFHPTQKGLISGLIVGGFGIAAVYYAPLTDGLLNSFGISGTFTVLGAVTLIIGVCLAQFVQNPPSSYVPAAPRGATSSDQKPNAAPSNDVSWKDILGTRRFLMLFMMFLLASSVGLMVIGNITKIAATQAHISDSTILAFLVSFLAFTNTLGRVAGGQMSDKIGRVNALFVTFILQMLNMAAFAFYRNLPTLILGIIVVGFCFGTLLSVLPAMCADQYGLRNFGMNYGILFLAWGFSGVVAPVFANFMFDTTGNFYTTYIFCALSMAGMIVVNYLLKRDLEASSLGNSRL